MLAGPPTLHPNTTPHHTTKPQIQHTYKVFLTGQIRDARDDSILYTEATCLFVTSTSGLLRRQSKLNMG